MGLEERAIEISHILESIRGSYRVVVNGGLEPLVLKAMQTGAKGLCEKSRSTWTTSRN